MSYILPHDMSSENSDTKQQEPDSEAFDLSTLADEIEVAGLQTAGDPTGLGDILERILSGDIPPGEVDDELRSWLNEQIDIPFIGEASEAVLFRQVQRILKSAIVSIIRRI